MSHINTLLKEKNVYYLELDNILIMQTFKFDKSGLLLAKKIHLIQQNIFAAVNRNFRIAINTGNDLTNYLSVGLGDRNHYD